MHVVLHVFAYPHSHAGYVSTMFASQVREVDMHTGTMTGRWMMA